MRAPVQMDFAKDEVTRNIRGFWF